MVYTDTQDLHEFLNNAQVDQLRGEAPGDFRTPDCCARQVSAKNRCHQPGHQAKLCPNARVSWCRRSDHGLGMSQVVFASHGSPQRDFRQNQPFGFRGVRIPVAGSG